MSLPDDTIERYSRQIILPSVGGAGQQALLRTHTLVRGKKSGTSVALLYCQRTGLGIFATPTSKSAAAPPTDKPPKADAALFAGRPPTSEELSLLRENGRYVFYILDPTGWTLHQHRNTGRTAAGPAPAPDEAASGPLRWKMPRPICLQDSPDPRHIPAACDAVALLVRLIIEDANPAV